MKITLYISLKRLYILEPKKKKEKKEKLRMRKEVCKLFLYILNIVNILSN